MPRWRRHSVFGAGPRVPLDRERRAQFRAMLPLQRRPGRLTIAAAHVGRVLLDTLGPNGPLDPSLATLAAKAALHPATVARALAQLRAFGFLDWTRRLVRDPASGWRAAQASNAYVLCVPACNAQFAPPVYFMRHKEGARGRGAVRSSGASGPDAPDRAGALNSPARVAALRAAALAGAWRRRLG